MSESVRVAPARTPRWLGLAAFALIALVGIISLPVSGLAGDNRTGSEVEIESTERITEDLYVAARSFTFAGTATGDVLAAAGGVDVTGDIDGSLMVAAGEADLDGDIGGSLRIASGRVHITGSVAGDVLLMAGRLELASGATIGGNLILGGGDVDLYGTVNGDINGWVGDLTIAGAVQGAVDVRAGSLAIDASARIAGPVTYSSRTEADVSPGAQVAQGITREELDPWGNGEDAFSRAAGSLLRIIWALIAGVVLVVAAPRLANALGGNAKRLMPALPLGLLALIATPLAIVLLMVTVIGFPAGLIVLGTYLVALYLTQVIVGMAIGRFILPNGWNDGSRGFHLLAMAIGVILIGALRFIPLPYVHGLIMLVITVWGLGAVAMLLASLNHRGEALAG